MVLTLSSNKISSTSEGYKVIIIRCIRDYASFFEFILVLFSWIYTVEGNQNNTFLLIITGVALWWRDA